MKRNVLSASEMEFLIGSDINNAMDAFQESDRSDFSNGRRLACYEVLDTIKNELLIREIDVSRFGLDTLEAISAYRNVMTCEIEDKLRKYRIYPDRIGFSERFM